MNKKLPILLLVIQTSLSFSVMAQEPSITANLTPEQDKHEQKLKDLRRQTALIEAKHEQAKLLKDCQDMGIDCSAGEGMEMTPAMLEEMMLEEPEENPFQMVPGSPPQQQGMTQMPQLDIQAGTSLQSAPPELTAIQNNSAQLSVNGKSHWLNVGDNAGPWKVIYISATKVRLKNTNSDSVKTLLMTW